MAFNPFTSDIPKQPGIGKTIVEIESMIVELRDAYHRAQDFKARAPYDERMRPKAAAAIAEVDRIKKELAIRLKRLDWLLAQI